MTNNIKKGDHVKVIAGFDKGVEGKVLDVVGDRVIVEGVNRVKKHTRAGQVGGANTGGIITVEAPIHASNVMLVDPKTGLPTRIGYKVLENGKKVRVAKRSGATPPVSESPSG